MVEHEKADFTTTSDNFVKINYPYYLYVTKNLLLHQTNFGLYKIFQNKKQKAQNLILIYLDNDNQNVTLYPLLNTKSGSSIHNAKQGASLNLHLVCDVIIRDRSICCTLRLVVFLHSS